MKIRNKHSSLVLVAGLSIPPNRAGEIPDADWNRWLAASDGNKLTAASLLEIVPDEATTPEQGKPSVLDMDIEQQIEAVAVAIQTLPEGSGFWLKSGKPKIEPLTSKVGFEVTSGCA